MVVIGKENCLPSFLICDLMLQSVQVQFQKAVKYKNA